MSDYSNIEIQDHKGFREIKLNRPEKKNALNTLMIRELTEAFRESCESRGIVVIVLSGKGDLFCSGADLEWMKGSMDQPYEEYFKESQKLGELFQAVYQCSKIVISKVRKGCYGGANGLVAASDLALATIDTQFAFSEVKLGLVPATIAPYVMLKLGPMHSRKLMLTARVFNALEAKEANLINYAGSEGELEEYTDSLLRDILKNGPEALSNTKKLIREIEGVFLDRELMNRCAKSIAEARSGSEGQEGIRAFFEKRNPYWIQ